MGQYFPIERGCIDERAASSILSHVSTWSRHGDTAGMLQRSETVFCFSVSILHTTVTQMDLRCIQVQPYT